MLTIDFVLLFQPMTVTNKWMKMNGNRKLRNTFCYTVCSDCLHVVCAHVYDTLYIFVLSMNETSLCSGNAPTDDNLGLSNNSFPVSPADGWKEAWKPFFRAKFFIFGGFVALMRKPFTVEYIEKLITNAVHLVCSWQHSKGIRIRMKRRN